MSIVGRGRTPCTKAEGRLFQTSSIATLPSIGVKPDYRVGAVNGWRAKPIPIDKIQKRVEFDLYYIDNWSVWSISYHPRHVHRHLPCDGRLLNLDFLG